MAPGLGDGHEQEHAHRSEHEAAQLTGQQGQARNLQFHPLSGHDDAGQKVKGEVMHPSRRHGPGVVQQGHDALQGQEIGPFEVEVGGDDQGIDRSEDGHEGPAEDDALRQLGLGSGDHGDPRHGGGSVDDLEGGLGRHPFFSPTNQSSLRSKRTLKVVSEP